MMVTLKRTATSDDTTETDGFVNISLTNAIHKDYLKQLEMSGTTNQPAMFKPAQYPPLNRPSVAPSPVVPPQPLLPLLRPPTATAPPHPPRPQLPPPPAGFTRTLHAAPAAWPKQLRESIGTYSRDSAPFGPTPASETKEARAARINREKDTSITTRFAATEWTIDEARNSAQPAQWLASERWRRDRPVPGGVTLVFAHANGLQKEVSSRKAE